MTMIQSFPDVFLLVLCGGREPVPSGDGRVLSTGFSTLSTRHRVMTLLIYGAYGYTGELIAEEAVERGLETVVAGRNEVRTEHFGPATGL